MSVALHVNGSNGVSRTFSFDQEAITIGRDLSCHLVLHDSKRIVSRQHVQVRQNGNAYELIDLGSKNPTIVDGRPLEAGKAYPLKDGTIFTVGEYFITFKTLEPEPQLSTQPPSTVTLGQEDSESTASLYTRLIKSFDQDTSQLREKKLIRAIEELAFLNELAAEIGASSDSQTIINRIVHASIKAVNAEQGNIKLLADPSDSKNEQGLRTLVRSGLGQPLHLSEALLDWVVHTKRPVLINEPSDHEHFGTVISNSHIRSLLCVPLMVRSRVIGMLSVFNKLSSDGFSEEDQRLLSIISAQSAQVIENARLMEEEKRLIRMQKELDLAWKIQVNLLPKEVPKIEGYDISGVTLPAQTVGGDYFDFIQLDEKRWAFAVGDVSGKGLPASLLMANLQATLRGQALWSSSISQCLERSNNLLCRSTGKSAFVTLFYGELNILSHSFQFGNAGHNRPLLYRDQGHIEQLDTGGLVLGFLEDQSYPEGHISFHPGDVLIIYSDGIVEAVNENHEEFGVERLRLALNTNRAGSARQILDGIISTVRAFYGSVEQRDDMTLLVIKRNGA